VITIVDYGMGNLGSIHNMFKRIGARSTISSEPSEIARASKIVMPGVGAFDHAITRITELGLRDVLNQKALVEQVPVLGICLGMQIMTRRSEEGTLPGLNWIPAVTRRFVVAAPLKVPHMGWNRVRIVSGSAMLKGFSADMRFYFVHSYHVSVDDPSNSMLRATYGVEFDAAIGRKNLFGVQFHPEKSHRFGKMFLANFAEL
jgi:imidazole glycerol-phosphate synthase subunit HisH